jgi:predicted transcriptional regulator
MKIQYQDIAELLGIDMQSAKIYLELLIHHDLKIDEIQKLTGVNKILIMRELRALIKCNLVTEIKTGKKTVFYQGISLLQLEEKLERDKLVFQHLKKVIVPALQQTQKLGILKYEGIEGIRKVYLEILEEAKKTGEDILAIESGIDVEVLGDAFVQNYINRRLSSKIKAYVITPNSSKDKEYKEDYDGTLTQIKLLPDFKIASNINIVGDLVMTFSIHPHQGTLRRDKAEADTFKSIFKKLWEI